jgi:hypothetical protein
VVRYVHLPATSVDTQLLEDATRRGELNAPHFGSIGILLWSNLVCLQVFLTIIYLQKPQLNKLKRNEKRREGHEWTGLQSMAYYLNMVLAFGDGCQYFRHAGSGREMLRLDGGVHCGIDSLRGIALTVLQHEHLRAFAMLDAAASYSPLSLPRHCFAKSRSA